MIEMRGGCWKTGATCICVLVDCGGVTAKANNRGPAGRESSSLRLAQTDSEVIPLEIYPPLLNGFHGKEILLSS